MCTKLQIDLYIKDTSFLRTLMLVPKCPLNRFYCNNNADFTCVEQMVYFMPWFCDGITESSCSMQMKPAVQWNHHRYYTHG